MIDENADTTDLTTNEILRQILARLTDVETELATLRATVDDRLKDTRPIWQAINARTERMEAQLRTIDRPSAAN